MVNETVVDALGITDTMAVAGAGAITSNVASSNLVAHQDRMWLQQESALASLINGLVTVDPAEAAALSVLGQQAAKVAQTTPPSTS